jgi:hypothetical protein
LELKELAEALCKWDHCGTEDHYYLDLEGRDHNS